ncbi:MAG: hypothetical protein AB1758_26360, partial [Candidatus Eremiobacterota bacterium]
LPPAVVEPWVGKMLQSEWGDPYMAAVALAEIALSTGDRARDLDEGLRTRVADRMKAEGAPPGLVECVTLGRAVDDEGVAAFLGEALPVGLRL